jgi:hypothetical protein
MRFHTSKHAPSSKRKQWNSFKLHVFLKTYRQIHVYGMKKKRTEFVYTTKPHFNGTRPKESSGSATNAIADCMP